MLRHPGRISTGLDTNGAAIDTRSGVVGCALYLPDGFCHTLAVNEVHRANWLESLIATPGYVAFELDGPGDVETLMPEERTAITSTVPHRAAEFAGGRQCAKAAMSALGVDDAALPVGSGRQPAWPDGVVGSISHTHGYCLAVAASRAADRRTSGSMSKRSDESGATSGVGSSSIMSAPTSTAFPTTVKNSG